jgi:hypothetical protein
MYHDATKGLASGSQTDATKGLASGSQTDATKELASGPQTDFFHVWIFQPVSHEAFPTQNIKMEMYMFSSTHVKK